jgi:ABC-type branched-subunit amino acid transport system substrate-binding protein
MPGHWRSIVAACLVAVSACSDDPGDVTDVTEVPVTTPAALRVDDEVLRLGLLRDTNAPAAMETAVVTATRVAVEEVNAAGGVADRPVEIVEAGGPESDLTTDAALALLLDNDVDVVIGPMSSTDALSYVGTIVDSGALSCSPTASALALDQFPDDQHFFRTIPSDSLEAAAIATSVEGVGPASATLAYLDDPYGRPFAEAVRVELEARGVPVAAAIPYSGSSAAAAAALEVAAGAPSVLVVIGDPVSGPALIQAVERVMPGNPPMHFVNSAQRTPELAQPLAAALLARIIGVAPDSAPVADAPLLAAMRAIDPATGEFYAANAYDCVGLAALGAVSAGSTDPDEIAAEIVGVSTSGSPCTTYTQCRAQLEAGRNIDYDGASAVLDLSESGDPSRAAYVQFRYTAQGDDTTVDRFVVSGG